MKDINNYQKNNNWFTVDGTKTEEEISEEILNIVKNRI